MSNEDVCHQSVYGVKKLLNMIDNSSRWWMASLPQSVSYTSETSILTNQIKLSASSQQVFITNIKCIQSIDFVFIFCNEWSVNND